MKIHPERTFCCSLLGLSALVLACVLAGAHERKRGSIGYIDKTGQLLLTSKTLQEASSFSGGFARVRLHEKKEYKYGYLDRKGKLAIGAQFDWARNFSEGLAWVESPAGQGYIDGSGKLAIRGEYKAGGDFSGGLAAVQAGKGFGYIDPGGKLVIPARYSSAG